MHFCTHSILKIPLNFHRKLIVLVPCNDSCVASRRPKDAQFTYTKDVQSSAFSRQAKNDTRTRSSPGECDARPVPARPRVPPPPSHRSPHQPDQHGTSSSGPPLFTKATHSSCIVVPMVGDSRPRLRLRLPGAAVSRLPDIFGGRPSDCIVY